jgi:RHH-type rel operon transcriptional repressor/antitoxin RelB
MLALRLPADIEKRLEDLARKTGRSTSEHALEAIVEHLDDLEDLHLAEQRLAELNKGQTSTISLAEMMKAHGVEN